MAILCLSFYRVERIDPVGCFETSNTTQRVEPQPGKSREINVKLEREVKKTRARRKENATIEKETSLVSRSSAHPVCTSRVQLRRFTSRSEVYLRYKSPVNPAFYFKFYFPHASGSKYEYVTTQSPECFFLSFPPPPRTEPLRISLRTFRTISFAVFIFIRILKFTRLPRDVQLYLRRHSDNFNETFPREDTDISRKDSR